MVDILHFNTKIGKGIASKLISAALSKKLGYKVVVELDKLYIRNDNNLVRIVFSGEATAPTSSIKF